MGVEYNFVKIMRVSKKYNKLKTLPKLKVSFQSFLQMYINKEWCNSIEISKFGKCCVNILQVEFSRNSIKKSTGEGRTLTTDTNEAEFRKAKPIYRSYLFRV